MSTTFVAVYRGESINIARLVAVSSEPQVVAQLAREITGETLTGETEDAGEERQPLTRIRDEGE